MTRNELLERIHKLMSRTTTNGATEAEAATALLMAQRLMDEHNIAVAEIESAAGEGHDYAESVAWRGTSADANVCMVLPILDECFAVRALLKKSVARGATGRTKTVAVRVAIFGDAANVEAATWALKFLSGTFKDLWAAYRARTGAGTAAVTGYYGGLQAGFLAKVRAQRIEADRQLPGSGRALAVVAGRLDQAFAEQYPTATAMTKASRDDSAFADGVRDGCEINLARPIGAGRKGQLESA
jgi:hypothetical protein